MFQLLALMLSHCQLGPASAGHLAHTCTGICPALTCVAAPPPSPTCCHLAHTCTGTCPALNTCATPIPHHPHTVLPTEWKAAFQLESAYILDELRCWLTHAGPEEDVLGLPLTFTQNPATKK